MTRRYTHHPLNGEFITLDDLELFAEELRTRGMPGTSVIRTRSLLEINFDGGPRARTITAEAEPSADDLYERTSEKVDEAVH